jgi:hypothetical protein
MFKRCNFSLEFLIRAQICNPLRTEIDLIPNSLERPKDYFSIPLICVFRDRQVRSPEALDYGRRSSMAGCIQLNKTAPTIRNEGLETCRSSKQVAIRYRFSASN